MSALRDLHRRLHSRDNKDLLNREVSPDNYDTDELGEKKEENFPEKKSNENLSSKNQNVPDLKKVPKVENQSATFSSSDKKMEEISLGKQKFDWSSKKKWIIFGGTVGVLLVLVGISIGYVKYIQNSFKQENVLIEFEGKEEVRSGGVLAQKLLINNNNRVALKIAKIKVFYPEELKPIYTSFMEEGPGDSFYIDVGTLNKFESKDYELRFEAYSGFDNEVYLKTELTYQPDNFSSNFNKQSNYLVDIRGSAIGFSLISAKEAASGELLKFIGILKNNGNEDLDNLILEIDHPTSFQLESPNLDKLTDSKNRFKLPKLNVGEKREIDFLGSFIGEVNSIENLITRVGVIEEEKFLEIVLAEEVIKIIPSRIAISQEILAGTELEELVTETGKTLKYQINFKNNSSSPLSDLILKENIKGDLLDVDSIRLTSGYFDKDKKEIIWKASEVPALKNLNPGESGLVEFQLSTKEDFVPERDRNQIIITKAKISSPSIDTAILSNQEISSGEKIVKVRTNLDILVSGNFDDSVFNNEGPIPLELGKETTFTVKVALKNSFNRVRDPKISIKLPSGIAWKSSYHRSSGEVSFNERTNELTWTLNSLDSQIGHQKPAEELAFQIGLTPQSDQAIKDSVLVSEVLLKGFEEFIEENISKKADKFELKNIENYDF